MKYLVDAFLIVCASLLVQLCTHRPIRHEMMCLDEAIIYHFQNTEEVEGYCADGVTANSKVFVGVYLKHFQESDSLFILSAHCPMLAHSSPFEFLGFVQKKDTVIFCVGEESEKWPNLSKRLCTGPLNEDAFEFEKITFVPPMYEHVSKVRVTVGGLSEDGVVNVKNETRGLRFTQFFTHSSISRE